MKCLKILCESHLTKERSYYYDNYSARTIPTIADYLLLHYTRYPEWRFACEFNVQFKPNVDSLSNVLSKCKICELFT